MRLVSVVILYHESLFTAEDVVSYQYNFYQCPSHKTVDSRVSPQASSLIFVSSVILGFLEFDTYGSQSVQCLRVYFMSPPTRRFCYTDNVVDSNQRNVRLYYNMYCFSKLCGKYWVCFVTTGFWATGFHQLSRPYNCIKVLYVR